MKINWIGKIIRKEGFGLMGKYEDGAIFTARIGSQYSDLTVFLGFLGNHCNLLFPCTASSNSNPSKSTT